VSRQRGSLLTKITAALSLPFVLALTAASCNTHGPSVPIQYPTAIAWAESYEAAMTRAKTEGKPVILIVGAGWCAPCHTLARYVLSDPRVIERSKDFVVVHVDADAREDLMSKYGARTLPYTLFLSPSGEVLTGAGVPWRCRIGRYNQHDPAELLT